MESLLLLNRTHRVSLSGMRLTLPVLMEESRIMSERPQIFPLAHKQRYAQPSVDIGWFSGLRSVMGSYLPYGSVDVPITAQADSDAQGYYGRSAEDLVAMCSGVPPVMDDLRSIITSECSKIEGIFRGTPNVSLPVLHGNKQLTNCRLLSDHP